MLSCAIMAATAAAQDFTEFSEVLDEKEDTTQVVTIADIINVQELVTNSNLNVSHFSNVWGRQKYFDISYGNVKMTPKADIPLGYTYNGGIAPAFTSDWGLALKLGRNYSLHKKPIANTLKFNMDFTYFDLNFTHFKAEGDGKTKLYDSAAVWQETTDDETEERSYIPWCLQKYKADFGMAVGPSLTIAPFNYLNGVNGLHYLKFNVYYHFGYHVSILWMANDDKLDVAEENPRDTSQSYLDKNESANLKMNWGHGITSTFGFSMSWKMIGIGYEIRHTNLKYKSVSPSIYGHDSYKFDTTSNRVYLQIRY